jgi:hypothetical protein
MTPTNQKCVNCVHFFIDGEGWELPQYDFANCKARPNFANLKSFPFKNTKCRVYEEK